MFTFRRSAWIRWLPPIDSASPSPVITHTDRSGRDAASPDAIGYNKVRGLPFTSAELTEVITEALQLNEGTSIDD